METKATREHFGSRIGFILTTSGAAIGLGNIQRFPYMAVTHGGGLFLLIYLLCVIAIGLPLILVEFAIGRKGQKNPMASIASIHPKGLWKYAGFLGVMTAFLILSYYLVASSWALGYVIQMIQGETLPWKEFVLDFKRVFFLTFIFAILVIIVIQEGLKKGVERASKIIMPILFILLLILVIRSLSLPNAYEGCMYYLKPDFSKFTPKIFLYALSQAFFSLCVGEGVLITYGSYTSSKENIVTSSYAIAFFDTLVAFLSGLIIFPALFSFGGKNREGIGLLYDLMPEIFLQMPFGKITGIAFFLILSFAAFTTCLALLEIPVNFVVQTFHLSRKKSTWILGSIALILSIPASLSLQPESFFASIQLPFIKEKGWYEIMDFFWGGIAMVLGGFFLVLFAGWIWGVKNALIELKKGSHITWEGYLWSFIVKFIAPLVILLILITLFFPF